MTSDTRSTETAVGVEGALSRLRAYCLGFPETTETDAWGHPNFKAGKRTFAAFEWVKGRPSIAIHLGSERAEAFLFQHKGSFETPYGRGKWVSVWADEPLDWSYIEDAIDLGYRGVALKRMIAALDGRQGNA